MVSTDLEANNHDWRLKYGIHQSCKNDAPRMCKEEMKTGGGEVLACLKSKRNDIQDRMCKAEMFRYMQQGANNIRHSGDTYAACVDDVKLLCADSQPGRGEVHECLVKNKNVLSYTCAEAEFREQRIQ